MRTRSGPTAQRAARAAVQAKRPTAAVRSPAGGVDVGGSADGALADVTEPDAATVAPADDGAVGSPGYLADFPALGSPPGATAGPGSPAVADDRVASVPAPPARVAKSRGAGAKAAKAAKSVSGNGREGKYACSEASTVVVSPYAAPAAGGRAHGPP